MSFGSENPELYSEMCKRGIATWLKAEMKKNGHDEIDDYTVDAVVEVLYELPKIESPLSAMATTEISNEEADYWGGKIDEAVMRHEAKKGY